MKTVTHALFLLLFLFSFTAASTFQEPGDKELENRAKARTKVLENAIKQVIRYGQNDWDAHELIQETLMPNFMEGATIQSASISTSGAVKKNTPRPYEEYFFKIWERARKDGSLKVYFSDISIKPNGTDKYRYRVIIRFHQEYETAVYGDTTTKEVEIHFLPQANGTLLEKIGNTIVVTGKRK